MHASIPRRPLEKLMTIQEAWSFAEWKIVVGPFPPTQGKNRFLVIAVDYFIKWVEVEPLPIVTGKKTLNFVWRNIVC